MRFPAIEKFCLTRRKTVHFMLFFPNKLSFYALQKLVDFGEIYYADAKKAPALTW